MKKVLVLSAHDDDAIIGVGGILMLRHRNDKVKIQIFTDGRNSHVVVLGVHESPSPTQVKSARRQELEIAYGGDLANTGLNLTHNQWFYPDTCGVLTKKKVEVKKRLTNLITSYKPDIIYFHAPDAHQDHRLVHFATNEVMEEIGYTGQAFTFSIWTKELAEQRPEVDASLIQDLSKNSEIVDISSVLDTKEEALNRFISQVKLKPYPGWALQKSAILEDEFLKYFLRGEEIITRVK